MEDKEFPRWDKTMRRFLSWSELIFQFEITTKQLPRKGWKELNWGFDFWTSTFNCNSRIESNATSPLNYSFCDERDNFGREFLDVTFDNNSPIKCNDRLCFSLILWATGQFVFEVNTFESRFVSQDQQRQPFRLLSTRYPLEHYFVRRKEVEDCLLRSYVAQLH